MDVRAEEIAAPSLDEVAALLIDTLELTSIVDDEAEAFGRAVGSWLGASASDCRAALDRALGPRLERKASPLEVKAYASWFGEAAARSMEDAEHAGLDLDAFAARTSARHAIGLLEVLCAVTSAHTGIDPREARRLEFAGRRLRIDPVVVAAAVRRFDPRYGSGLAFPLEGDRIVIGSGPTCDIVLPDPQVQARNAELVRQADGWRVVDLGRARPVLVHDQPVASAPLAEGGRFRLGPYHLELKDRTLVARSGRGFSSLSSQELSRRIGSTVLLDRVTCNLVAGEVIAVVGPSGGGKSTLVAALQGTAPADQGSVLFDGRDFHELLEQDPALAGSVPQDDLVLPELTVRETLTAAARLRFGGTDESVRPDVDRVLAELDLLRIADSRIGDALRRGISGGQRKRVNLGQELLGRSNRVLFLDEPTSGLDPQASQDIVRLLRRLADNGRIVVLVTHDLSPEVVGQVDHLLVLARGGRVAWFGPPSEACAWFGVPTPDALFHRLSDRSPEEWADAFRTSEAARTYVATREAAIALGLLGSHEELAPSRRSSGLEQFRTLVGRYVRTKWRDQTGTIVLAAQPPVLAGGMAIVYPGVAAGTVFMLMLSCFWFGLFAAVRELIADRVLWRRERRIGVGVAPYLASKVGVLGLVTALQCLVMVSLCWMWINFGVHGFSFAEVLGVATLTGWSGMGMALVVSSTWTSSEAAVGTLPILLVPQILFSSILVSIRNMDPISQALTWVTVLRYGLDAALKCGVTIEQPSRVSSEWETHDLSGALYGLGLKPLEPTDMGLPLWTLSSALGGWVLVFLVITSVAVWRRDRR